MQSALVHRRWRSKQIDKNLIQLFRIAIDPQRIRTDVRQTFNTSLLQSSRRQIRSAEGPRVMDTGKKDSFQRNPEDPYRSPFADLIQNKPKA